MTTDKQKTDQASGQTAGGAKPPQPGQHSGSNKPDLERAANETESDDLTTGHSDPDDGGDDNAK